MMQLEEKAAMYLSRIVSALPSSVYPKRADAAAEGAGILNSLINSLPIEMHMPGYSYLGPGTYLSTKLPLNYPPKNKLDALALEHDKAYHYNKSVESRKHADDVLIEGAWERVKAPDSYLGEETAAWITTNAMKLKRATGAGTYECIRKLGKDWENQAGGGFLPGLTPKQNYF